jgi:pimeloyl-ACP methyl ester carboxylesterase
MHARVADGPASTEAPPMVLVHGVGVSGRYLLPLAECLARHHPTYVPDLPGFGRSDKPARALTVAELTDALASWAESADSRRATYVGNSMGCQYIVDLAFRYPHLIQRAVLIGPTVDPAARSLWGQAFRGVRDMLREPLKYWPLLLADYWIAGPLRTMQTLRYGVADPLSVKLPAARVPTLVVRGERDPIAPQRSVEEIARLLPDGRVATIPGAAHTPNFTAPEPLARVIEQFVQSRSLPERRFDKFPIAL